MSSDGVGRNSPCPCGSNVKYKNCHLRRFDDETVEAETILEELGLVIVEKDNEV
ncbi:preprotein translocase subunit [Vibrio phage pVa-21]|nr:preprotein translocase subunit [Vibrio phage pVa-21]